MQNRWNDDQAAAATDVFEECVYASQLIGAERALVSYGGGNTSVKRQQPNLFGEPVDVLYVKASGCDLSNIRSDGFTSVDLARVRRLVELDQLSDTAMLNELKGARLDVTAPHPSVEAIIHAVLPAPAVFHAHPNSLLAISNTADGESRIRELYGDQVVVVPYAMPGFRAAKLTSETFRAEVSDATVGVVLLNHGLFTFGDTPRQAYERMIDLVDTAENYLAANSVAAGAPAAMLPSPPVDRIRMAELRSAISDAAGGPCIVRRHTDPASWAFSQRPDLGDISQQGVATPDQVIWTKRLPLVGTDVEAYAEAYQAYFNRHVAGRSLQMLDPAPRVILDPEMGMVTAGRDAWSESAAGDIYLQIIDVIEHAEGLGGYRALPASEVFDLEYWELEQLKLERNPHRAEFTGEVAVVTGANSGIGRGCALALLDRGAAVIGLDINPAVAEMTDHIAYLGVACDLSSLEATDAALDRGVERFGGIDMVVAAAGLFPESAPISDHEPTAWHRAMSVNVDGLVQLLSLVHPLLLRAPRGGRLTVIGSKNVAAPGPGASAYSASKAAANQIARVAALEWAPDGIRVNSVHPDAVFDTALWTPELLAERAKRYGMSIEEYKRRNLLGIEITSAAVGDVVATTLGNVFAPVTGAHIPIDGGNERVI